MIAALDTRKQPTPPLGKAYTRFLDGLTASGFEGEVTPDYAARTVLATDNSIYQRWPQAVVYPRHAEDLERLTHLAAQPTHRDIILTPRGGGTGTNGQSLTDGIVVDISRHMNRILEIDARHRRVRVQAGVVKDQLNAALKPHGLFFAPELSTSNRATIGGMISTDASGQGSCEYGKTRDHVLELDTVLLGGQHLHSRPLDQDEEAVACSTQGMTGDVHTTAAAVIDQHQAAIKACFPPLNRCLTGYDLAHLRTESGKLNINSLLCGSEGTLGLLNEAVLNVLPIPRHSILVNVRYAGFMDALGDAKSLMGSASRPTSIETVDDKVLLLAMEDFVWDQVAEFFPVASTPVRGINLVEFNDDDPDRLEQRVEAFVDHLDHDTGVERLGCTLARGHEQIQSVYAMRKRAVGLLGNAKGEKRPIAFVEDTAVPPEHLAEFIAEFRQILDSYRLDYGMFGHVDAGVLHVRPALDMKDPEQQRLIRDISDQVVELTQKYGGLLWGEHGKGVRSSYGPRFFGQLYPVLQQIKHVFDPHNQLNPGKIASPQAPSSDDRQANLIARDSDPRLLSVDGVTLRGELDRQIDERAWQAYDAAVTCNGNGACYNYDLDDPMCPSWKASRDRIQSPKGRASLVREWLRLQEQAGIDVVEESRRQRREGPLSFIARLPGRAFNRLRQTHQDDFSHQVYDAMSTCLACKSCAGQCPIKVNVPQFRSQFLEVYHGRYLRPLRDYLVGGMEFMLPTMARLAPVYNAIIRQRLVDTLMVKGIGISDSPPLSRLNLKRQLKAWGIAEATPTALAMLTEQERANSVILVQDGFTSHFEAQLVMDIVELLSRTHHRVFVMPFSVNGKPLQVQGFLGAFERTAAKQAARLRALARFEVPLVGIDPAMTLTYRQEYVKALGHDAVPSILMLQEWLLTRLPSFPISEGPLKNPGYTLLSHCTEKTNAPGSPKAWQQIFEAAGLTLELASTGCCGMSGTYGHETRNVDTSKVIYAQSWQPRVEAKAHSGRLLATGYSCRSQVKRFSDRTLLHPLQALLEALQEAEGRKHQARKHQES